MSVGPPAASDIFVSYAREDRERAEALVHVLEQQGWSVWWDRELTYGGPYRKEIQEKLTAARCVVVLWSRYSVDSDWVPDEASTARERGVLVPVLLEENSQPLGFGGLHSVRLTDWDGSPSHLDPAELLRGVGGVLGRRPHPNGQPPSTVNWGPWIVGAALATPLIGVATLGTMPLSSVEIAAEITASRVGFTLATEEAVFTSPISLESLGIAGLREFRVTPTRRYDQSVMRLAAHPGNPAGTIDLEMPLLPAGTRITLDGAGSFVGAGRGLRFSFEGVVPELSVSLNGPVQIVGSGEVPVNVRYEAHHDRLVAQPELGVIDLDLFLAARSTPSFATLDSVESLAFARVGKLSPGEGERRADDVGSTVVSGGVSFPLLGRDTQRLVPGSQLAFASSHGKLRVVGMSGGHITLNFTGAVEGLHAGALKVPSRLDRLVGEHRGPLAAAAALYLVAAGIVALRWKRRRIR